MHMDDGWIIRIHLRIRHCALKDSQLKSNLLASFVQ